VLSFDWFPPFLGRQEIATNNRIAVLVGRGEGGGWAHIYPLDVDDGGTADDMDNCLGLANTNQADEHSIGDACDELPG
jgi:hypothetical protein